MSIPAQIDSAVDTAPDPWNEDWKIRLPLDHIICRDVDGAPHTVQEFIWPWSAYTKNHRKLPLHFYYWNQKRGLNALDNLEVSAERRARILELQFLMTRQIYFGTENAPKTLEEKLRVLHFVARFAEARSCSIHSVLTDPSLLDACGASLPDALIGAWMTWLNFLNQLDSHTQTGFILAKSNAGKILKDRVRAKRDKERQYAPLPTRIYATVINNLSTELDDIEAHADRLEAALREAMGEYMAAKDMTDHPQIRMGPALIKKYGLADYLLRRGFNVRHRALYSLSGAITELFQVCKLEIHLFSGMRQDEAATLPYHCLARKIGQHGRTHSLISGTTTKFNKGRPLRTNWVTTEQEGFRAIRLAQRFALLVYESLNVVPSKAELDKDKFPLFPSVDYLPWGRSKFVQSDRIQTSVLKLHAAKEPLFVRICPLINEEDIAELEEIDPFRAWHDEPEFAVGQRWALSTHQLRRSLAIYANASGLVQISSLRRQLQHITREMSLYYGRGSTFCKNFIANDPHGYQKHIAREWQEGEDEAAMLAFMRDVLNSDEPMFGGAGNFYQRQKERGAVMSKEEATKQMKAGLLSYKPGPLGGCTKSGGCTKPKGLNLVDVSCATDVCKHLVGKHSKIIRVIQLKRASMEHTTQNSIEADMEREELTALERIEREWRVSTPILQNGAIHAKRS